jgi:catechol 2,3-dioxygenase-like lactoylglutathione lyase family enzyme
MFDHVTLRVPDLAAASLAFVAALDQLEIEQTTKTPTLSVWGNFALTQADAEHPVARRIHIAFGAPTPAHIERFAQAGIAAGFTDDGPAGPRPQYGDDYYAATLKDAAGNSPAATSTTSSSMSTTSRRQLRFTQRSAQRPASRPGAKPLIARGSLSAGQTALCS